jgi:hypothetical protein
VARTDIGRRVIICILRIPALAIMLSWQGKWEYDYR